MKLQNALLIGIIISILGLVAWEMHWRSLGYTPIIDDDNELWAIHRSKVDHASDNDVVILGSSRVYFNLQLNEWEKEAGVRPIQLAIEGASPQYTFEDIVNNSDFSGTIILGVTEGLFFSTLFPAAPPNEQPVERVKYLRDRTYAQRLNHKLSLPFQHNLAFVSEIGGVDGIKLKELLRKIKIGDRVPDPMPPFPLFAEVDDTRNLRMMDKFANDTANAAIIQRVWMFYVGMMSESGQLPEKEATTEFFLNNLSKFKDRGGKLILLRSPSTEKLREIEKEVFPRKDFWDQLVDKAQVPAYHFEDYPQFKDLECPEWSHLSGEDADYFTREFVKLLIKDGHLQKNTSK